eukprot:11378258-Karenia_brevis.AAC.1
MGLGKTFSSLSALPADLQVCGVVLLTKPSPLSGKLKKRDADDDDDDDDADDPDGDDDEDND